MEGAGFSLGRLNRTEDALEVFTTATELDPEDEDSWVNRAVAASSPRTFESSDPAGLDARTPSSTG
jgi:hypothetical protein